MFRKNIPISKQLAELFYQAPANVLWLSSRTIAQEDILGECVCKKWTTGTPAKEEANRVQNALKNWNVPAALVETVLMSMTIETSHHAYVGQGQPRTGQSYNTAIFDYFILDPINGWLIIIIHAT